MRRPLSRRAGRFAFTLTETLIVMTVLGLLVAIVVPTIGRVAALGRSALCKDHLRRITEAYLDHKVGERMDYSDGVFAANIWTAQVMPLLGWQEDVLFCPEDPEPYWSLPEVGLTIYSYGGLLYQVQAFDAHPYWLEQPLSDFDPGERPGMWCVNDDVYSSIKDGAVDRTDMPQFTPGTDPRVTWWIIEDQRIGKDNTTAGGDEDFNDLDIKLTDLGGGVYQVAAFHGDAGYTFGLVSPDGEETRESNGTIGPLNMLGEGGSYGVNWRATNFVVGTQKILAMDYGDLIVYAGGDLLPDQNNWDEMLEARHLGRVNYALTSGAILSARPEDIDPADAETDEKLWDPLGAN